jgi:thioredoxin reductase
MTYELVIVGGGPCGASAAIFAGRAGLTTAVVDKGAGMTDRALVNNHLGLPDGITGPELADLGRRHALKSGVEWIDDEVTSLSVQGDVVTLGTVGGRTLQAHDVLLAQGVNMTLARASGLETEPGREPWIETVLTVDPDGRTSVPHVWAAGTSAGTSVHTIVVAGDGARVSINLITGRRGQRRVDHDKLDLPVT